jgi:hypothetical protein
MSAALASKIKNRIAKITTEEHKEVEIFQPV